MRGVYRETAERDAICGVYALKDGRRLELVFCRTKPALRAHKEALNANADGVLCLCVLDYRDDAVDPDIQVADSWRVGRRDRADVLDALLDYHAAYPCDRWRRTRAGLLREWGAHNVAYRLRILRARVGDVDFNQKGEPFWAPVAWWKGRKKRT